MHDWPSAEDAEELYDWIAKIEPKYDPNVRAWSQFERKMPDAYKFFKTHARFSPHCYEITVCKNTDCVMCRERLGRSVRTPETKDGALRARVLSNITRPVVDTKGGGEHFMKPADARKYSFDNNLSLEELKKQMPEAKGRPGVSKEMEEDKKKDTVHGQVWRGKNVRDIIQCSQCGFLRCIFSKYAKGSKHNDASVEQQERRWNLLQDWKETTGYVCGMVPTVRPYLMKSQLRCWDSIETQYYSGGRTDICALCGNDEHVLTSEEVKYEKDVKGKQPLPLCQECVKMEIEPPIKQGRTTNFV